MAAPFLKRLKGDSYLAYRALVAHPLKKLLTGDARTGKERFLANYVPEGLVPTTLADREILHGASRCIHCGLCDAHDAALSKVPRVVWGGASLLAVAYSRATPDVRHAASAVESITDEQLTRAEAVCPTRVPLRAIVAYLRRKLSELSQWA